MLTQNYFSLLVILGGIIDSQCLQLLSLTKRFFIRILIMHDNISPQVVDNRRKGLRQWMNSSIVHDNICPLIHKCVPKSYHSDTKYHLTLNIICCVDDATVVVPFYDFANALVCCQLDN